MSTRKFHRNSLQRRVILEELQKLKSHPTAGVLHGLVQKRLPKISLGTIYRNLEFLSQVGAIQKITISGGEARYDASIEPHQHVRCISCGEWRILSAPPLCSPRVLIKMWGTTRSSAIAWSFLESVPNAGRADRNWMRVPDYPDLFSSN